MIYVIPEWSSGFPTVKLLQSCPTLCDPRESSPPDSPVPGILQARVLEWAAISLTMFLIKLFILYWSVVDLQC